MHNKVINENQKHRHGFTCHSYIGFVYAAFHSYPYGKCYPHINSNLNTVPNPNVHARSENIHKFRFGNVFCYR